MNSSCPKVLVIGLDGATFDIIDPLVNAGKLPHLASLIRNGTRIPLRSTLMPNSFPAWTSCVTGVNPGKHGIFWSLIRSDGQAYPLRIMNSYDIKAGTLWAILGKQGYRVGVINVPTEYPPMPVNGFLVCGAMTPSEDSGFTYPEELKDEILRVVPDYRCEVDFGQIDLKRLSRQLIQSIENRERLLLYLLKNKSWDLLFAVFTETDLAQHKYWAGIDPRHPQHADFPEELRDFVYQVYIRIDESIGRIWQEISEETTTFVISDHGFGPFYQSFSLSEWLVQKGYLVLRRSVRRQGLEQVLARAHLLELAQIVKKRIDYAVASLKGNLNVRRIRDRNAQSSGRLIERIDWKKTRAYSTSDFGIRINLETREPQGTVPPGPEEDSLKEAIKKELSRLQFSNGQPVFEAVQTKEEAFSGPFVERASDLIVPVNHTHAPPKTEEWDFVLTLPNISGAHSPEGIFVASGKGIMKGKAFQRAQIIDMAPTILYIFHEPVPEDTDGEVLLHIFDPDFKKNRRITRKGSSISFKPEKKVFSDEEEEQVEQKLRDLGYIG